MDNDSLGCISVACLIWCYQTSETIISGVVSDMVYDYIALITVHIIHKQVQKQSLAQIIINMTNYKIINYNTVMYITQHLLEKAKALICR